MAQIKTYCRMRPSDTLSQCFDWDGSKVFVRTPESASTGRVQGRTIDQEFNFGTVFGPHSTQDDVFDTVAKSIVDGSIHPWSDVSSCTFVDVVFAALDKGFLSGYNGTIFAYGQTGSGKTFTVEGGARKYSDRGLAPRALSFIYRALESRQDEDISVHVSYLEIYQESGFDLLSPSSRPGNIVNHLPKVHVVEGPQNTCIVRNLSMHLAADEHVAQELLLQGQANRKVAETPMNQRSSRSHAVFTIHLTSRSPGSEVITRSKLHLVDLAGSERAAKTGITGQQLDEAKFINLSLHHLERVIIALHDSVKQSESRHRSSSAGRIGSASSTRSIRPRSSSFHGSSRGYIPYRNSLLTMVLRDSLGGNCLTAMIATISIHESNMGESISTCRFAQRVACIRNHASRNEELDDRMVIKRLRRRIAELEAEIACLKAGNIEDGDNIQTTTNKEIEDSDLPDRIPRPVGLSDDDKKLCVKVMHGFIGGKIRDPVAAGVRDPYKFRECMHLLREMLMRSYAVEEKAAQNEDEKLYKKDRGRRDNRKRTRSHDNTQTSQDGPEEEKNVNEETPEMPKRVHSAPASESRRSRRDREMDHRRGIEEAHQILSPRSSGSGQANTRYNFKTPFEEKREKDIKRIGDKVDRYFDTQPSDQRELMAFQVTVKEEKLELMESQILHKLTTLKESIGQQHDYILHLKKNRADTETINNQKLVEHQLRTRQGKYERRLRFVQEQLQFLQDHELVQNEREHKPRNRGDDAVSMQSASYKEYLMDRYQHRDGRMNSRKVLELLKKEEKKQDKLQMRIEQQRVQAVSDHLAVKEAQTRQKLSEFKEKLKLAKEERKFNTSSQSSTANSSGNSANNSWWNSPPNKDNANTSPNKDNLMSPYMDSTNTSPNKDMKSPYMDNANSDTNDNSGNANTTTFTNSGLFESSPVNGWMNSTPKSHQKNKQRSFRSPQTDTHNNSDDDTNDSHLPNSGFSTRGVFTQSQNERKDKVPLKSGLHSEITYTNGDMAVEDIEESVQQTSKSSQEDDFLSSKKSDVSQRTSKSPFDNKFVYTPATNPMVRMSAKSKNKNDNNELSLVTDTHRERTTESEITYSPTEYLQNEDKYPFDPKKFSLSSKTFDSSMASMLEDSPALSQPNKDLPDWFSSSKWSNYSSGYGDSASQSGVSSPIGGRARSPLVQTRSVLSPEKVSDSNPLSMKEKLARYLDKAATSGFNKRAPPRMMMTRRGAPSMDYSVGDDISTVASTTLKLTSPSMDSFGTDPLSMYTTGTYYTSDGRQTPDSKSDLENEQEHSKESNKESKEASKDHTTKNKPKIKAMDDAEREQTYVNTVKQQRDRVAKIRRAVKAADTIQRAWRRYRAKKRR